MSSNITVHQEDIENVFRKTSEFLINWLKLYHNITQKTLVLLSGGSAVKIYKGLAKFLETSDLDFSFLAIGQVDERFRPDKSSEFIVHSSELNKNINASLIEKTGLWKVCKKKKIPYYEVSQEGTLEKSAEQYKRIVEKLFKEYVYKIAVLGIGEDGHTAGLLPGYEKYWNKKKYAAGYKNEGEFKKRISLTPKALRQLDQALVVAVGENKKQSLQKLLNGVKNESLNQFPAIIIRNISKVDLFTDLKIV